MFEWIIKIYWPWLSVSELEQLNTIGGYLQRLVTFKTFDQSDKGIWLDLIFRGFSLKKIWRNERILYFANFVDFDILERNWNVREAELWLNFGTCERCVSRRKVKICEFGESGEFGEFGESGEFGEFGESGENRSTTFLFYCSQMGPHLGTWIPMGTFFSLWSPLGLHWIPFGPHVLF